jgi:hypothetical protein
MMMVGVDPTGRIERLSTGDPEGFGYLFFDDPYSYVVDEFPNPDTQWYPPGLGEVADRPSFDVPANTTIESDGVDSVVFEFPFDVQIYVDDIPLESMTSTLTITSDEPAVYRVTVDHWPYLPYAVEVVVI